MIRVGVDEVYVTPDGDPQVAFLAVVWAVNRKCKERGIPVVFGEPQNEVEQGGAVLRERYEHADIVHVKDRNDRTIRIVPKTPLADELFGEVWPAMRDRVRQVQYAHNIEGVNLDRLENYLYLKDVQR